jgi:hypothetical protein
MIGSNLEVALARRSWLLGIGLLVMAGCGPSFSGCGPIGFGTGGELGNAVFNYQCTQDSDPICDDEIFFPGNEIPPIAVGGEFQVAWSAKTTGFAEPASRDLVSLRNANALVAERPGSVALLAKEEGAIVDLVHVTLEAVHHVDVEAFDQAGLPSTVDADFTMTANQDTTVRAMSMNESGLVLGGALPCQWAVADESIAVIVGPVPLPPNDNQIRILAKAPGTTTVQVTLGDQKKTFTLNVTGGNGGNGGAGGMGGAGGAGGGMGGAGGAP